ncbi:PAS domain-containing hybrid sensor histidine kinase/response regulator [Paucibacter sp. M5-1]|uniref:PAS domain-containing hybrid sensor histidine kinase/response regulator n=1 Tax=Paucibacter sp. M5-1 TaxID=3015998 RepID=UPI0022B867D4|nr:PAS domain S-box protein [Paucibacter sp. M5-1]MCZ7881053.1 PAS domain S-box protein [Paucibacter sp. M5-1]
MNGTVPSDVDLALLDAAYARKPLNVGMTLAVTLAMGLLLWPVLAPQALLAGCAALLASSLWGHLECRAYRRAALGQSNLRRWQRLFALQSAAAGLAWSVAPVLTMATRPDGDSLALFVGILLGVSAVAMNSMAGQRAGMFAFLLGTLLPTGLVAGLADAPAQRLVALVLASALLALLVVGHQSHLALRRLIETGMRLQANLDASHDAVVGMDDSGRITDWNRRAAELFGWTSAEAIGRMLDSTIIPERMREAHRQGLARYLATGVPRVMHRRVELPALHRDGREFVVEIALSPLGSGPARSFTAFLTDISERKAAQERLALFRRVFDASTQMISIVDGEGYAVYQNQAHQAGLGYRDEEIIGQHFSLTVAPEALAAFRAEIGVAMRNGLSWTGQLLLQRKDGSRFIASKHIGFIKDEQGRVQYAFDIFYDFSPELARREELAGAKETAERASMAKSDFLSSMSHELRTPMNAILGFAQILQYDGSLQARQLDQVQEILRAGRHLLDLVNEVLDLAKIESGHLQLALEPVPLAAVVDDCVQLMQALAAPRHIELQTQLPLDAELHADRTRVKQILLNLLSNAIKYNRDGGSVRLTAEPAHGRRWRISISDTGRGLSTQQIDQLFQPFNRLGAEQGSIEGTGIGLTITRRLTELMGGSVGVQSTLGEGSTFWLELPSRSRPTPAATEPPAAAAMPAVPLPSHSVLCIDDNPVNLRLLEQLLTLRPQIQVLTASSPAQGLALASAQRPSLILLDIHMPEMDGYAVLAALRADPDLQSIPVVAVSASAMPQDIERGRVAGFNDYLTKPLDLGNFLHVVDRWLSR